MQRALTLATLVAACSLLLIAPETASAQCDDVCRPKSQHAQRLVVERIVEGVKTPADVAALYAAAYASDAEFHDPLGSAEGVPAIIEKVVGGFELLGIDRLDGVEYTSDRRGHWVATYVMHARFQKRQADGSVVTVGVPLALEAVTSLKFDECGKIYYHRDYYDLLIGTFGQVPGLVDGAFGMFFGWLHGGPAPAP